MKNGSAMRDHLDKETILTDRDSSYWLKMIIETGYRLTLGHAARRFTLPSGAGIFQFYQRASASRRAAFPRRWFKLRGFLLS